jgi:uncharacterized damage-inducible protein DinB
MDAFTASARHLLDQAVEDMGRSLDGLSADALNWRPAGDDTNTIAALATHVMSSTRWWLSAAMGAPRPDRDRDSEFRASSQDSVALRAWVDDMAGQCGALLDAERQVDWGAMLKPDPDGPELPAAWALLHAMQHLREHEGQMSLTRQLWDARGS